MEGTGAALVCSTVSSKYKRPSSYQDSPNFWNQRFFSEEDVASPKSSINLSKVKRTKDRSFEKSVQYFTLNMVYITLYPIEKVPVYFQFLESFLKSWMGIDFYQIIFLYLLCWDDIIHLLYSINMVKYVDWFLNVEPTKHSRDKYHLGMMYYSVYFEYSTLFPLITF